MIILRGDSTRLGLKFEVVLKLRELSRLKWVEEPQVRRVLFGVRLLILHLKFQFSKSVKSSTFHIFLNLTYPLKKISHSQNVQKSPKNLYKTAKHW